MHFSQQVTRLVGAGQIGAVYKLENNEAVTLTQFVKPQEGMDIELTLSNGRFWGTTSWGGALSKGVIFSINPDGTGYTKVHEFNGATGALPLGGLVELGGKLWGLAREGGNNGTGVLYSLNLDGSSYEVAHHFAGTDGFSPASKLTVSGTELWGTAQAGGGGGLGTIFSFEPGGSFQVRHAFSQTEGNFPLAPLLSSNSRIWGTTLIGGDNFAGNVFSIKPDGTDFRVDYQFDYTTGNNPIGGLIESNGRLWGTTSGGGPGGTGTIFSIDITGGDFSIAHGFTFDPGDLGSPRGNLLAQGGKLWGATNSGGDIGYGYIYSVDEDGQNFTKHYDFKLTGFDGRYPWCSLVENNGRFWGAAAGGGETGNGILFSIMNDGTDYQVEHNFSDAEVTGWQPNSSFYDNGDKIIGTTQAGGILDFGLIYSINKDGSEFSILHQFDRTDGAAPTSLTRYANKLWGITLGGGSENKGTIFTTNLDGTNFEKRYDFDGTEGAGPVGQLIIYNEILWGVTTDGNAGAGNVFSLDPVSMTVTGTVGFESATGVDPRAGLVFANDKFWGIAGGGTLGYGVVYTTDLNGTNYEVVHAFSPEEGGNLKGPLLSAEGKIWGTSPEGKILFSVDEDGTNYAVRHTFDKTPVGGLTFFEGKIMGIVDSPDPAVFSINTDGTEYEEPIGLMSSQVFNRDNGGALTPILFDEPNIPPATPSIVAPLNNSTVAYDPQNRIEIDTNPDDLLDNDGDEVTKFIELWDQSQSSKILEKSAANDQPIFLFKTELQPHTTYTVKAKATDGEDTTPYSDVVTFSTPNFLPAFGIVSPSSGQIISYDASKEIDIVTSPSELTDEDNDNLTKEIAVQGPGLDTLITQPNNVRVFLNESRLQPSSTYTIQLTGTDGIATSEIASTTFKTPVVVGIDSELTLDNLKVYPNPFIESITVETRHPLKI
ncbi:MAG: choice-of-anchor tandem repeat GloVer-containing protein, partial [Cyclobacteriaceae bacterium]